ncbi:MAG TPA: hypothetical protein DF383_12275 [Deltaproteobacteria bacterium]|nr:hypothetical protein [Deltaproteobacteria bacterium]
MGDSLLDIDLKLSPFYTAEHGFSFSSRLALKWNPPLSERWKLVVGPELQEGREENLSATKVRLSSLQPDPRLPGHLEAKGGTDFRFGGEAYFSYLPSKRWEMRLGISPWDDTIQVALGHWSYQGFNDGNLADPKITLGPGGELRFHQEGTKNFPADLKLFTRVAWGGHGEALAAVDGRLSFGLFDKFKRAGWESTLGAGLGLFYPEGTLHSLLPGADPKTAGNALTPNIYLKQGITRDFEFQAGYGAFLPLSPSNDARLSDLRRRQAFNASADFRFNRDWAIHGQYGHVWRNDLDGVEGTQSEDHLGLSLRWMVTALESRAVNVSAGVTATHHNGQWEPGAYTALEISLKKFAHKKI